MIHLRCRFYKICQSYGLRRLRALRAAKNSNANYYHGVALRRGARPSRLPFSASRRKPVQQTNLSNDGSGATPEPARETRALPPNVQRIMILARRSSPAPSARHICRTKTKKTKSLTCLRHPLPSAGRGTKPRRAAYSLTIAQPFKAGIHCAQTSKSRQGRQTISFVPDGTRKFAGQFTHP